MNLALAEAAWDPALAARLLGSSRVVHEEVGLPLDADAAAAVRFAAGDAFESAHSEGRALTIREAAALVVNQTPQHEEHASVRRHGQVSRCRCT